MAWGNSWGSSWGVSWRAGPTAQDAWGDSWDGSWGQSWGHAGVGPVPVRTKPAGKRLIYGHEDKRIRDWMTVGRAPRTVIKKIEKAIAVVAALDGVEADEQLGQLIAQFDRRIEQLKEFLPIIEKGDNYRTLRAEADAIAIMAAQIRFEAQEEEAENMLLESVNSSHTLVMRAVQELLDSLDEN